MSEAAEALQPIVARVKPCLTRLEPGRVYWWCRCGRSKKQPFCDGSHKGTGFEPLQVRGPAHGEEVLLCGCKHTRTPPFCDGSHSNLPGGSPLDDPRSRENLAIPAIEPGADGRALLDGGCYVVSPASAPFETRGALRYRSLVSGALGATHHTLLYMQVSGGRSPAVSCGDRHAVLFVKSGEGSVDISGRRFDIAATDGVHVRPGEAFLLEASVGDTLDVLLSTCPHGSIAWLDALPRNFDTAFPDRVATVDVEQRQEMGPRFFQCLVGRAMGCEGMTQFIGHIPQSKAAPHRHLYEEAILVLAGEGCMWTQSRKAAVRSGDVIFLPARQPHSLEATAPGGMDVVGIIYPGDNPGINY